MSSRERKISNKVLGEVLRKHFGNRTLAARELGLTREEVSDRITSSPTLKRVIAEAEAVVQDLAEGTVVGAIKRGDPAAARWYLDHLPDFSKSRKVKEAEPEETPEQKEQRAVLVRMLLEEIDRRYRAGEPLPFAQDVRSADQKN